MPTAPEIRVARIDYGPLLEARLLNPKITADSPLLLATLDIRWDPPDPVAAVARLEEALLAVCPGLALHECRGPSSYHVLAGARRLREATPGGSGSRLEAPLALAHLVEHAIIDFQCDILGERRCSGITAARRAPRGQFDLIVECPDLHVGRCCLSLATTWLTSAALGHTLGSAEREILAAARLARARTGEPLGPRAVARALHVPQARAERALSALSEVGYLVETRYTVNLSGVPEYRICRG